MDEEAKKEETLLREKTKIGLERKLMIKHLEAWKTWIPKVCMKRQEERVNNHQLREKKKKLKIQIIRKRRIKLKRRESYLL